MLPASLSAPWSFAALCGKNRIPSTIVLGAGSVPPRRQTAARNNSVGSREPPPPRRGGAPSPPALPDLLSLPIIPVGAALRGRPHSHDPPAAGRSTRPRLRHSPFSILNSPFSPISSKTFQQKPAFPLPLISFRGPRRALKRRETPLLLRENAAFFRAAFSLFSSFLAKIPPNSPFPTRRKAAVHFGGKRGNFLEKPQKSGQKTGERRKNGCHPLQERL